MNVLGAFLILVLFVLLLAGMVYDLDVLAEEMQREEQLDLLWGDDEVAA